MFLHRYPNSNKAKYNEVLIRLQIRSLLDISLLPYDRMLYDINHTSVSISLKQLTVKFNLKKNENDGITKSEL